MKRLQIVESIFIQITIIFSDFIYVKFSDIFPIVEGECICGNTINVDWLFIQQKFDKIVFGSFLPV